LCLEDIMGLRDWWRHITATRFVKKAIKRNFAYWWEKYKDKDCIEKDALMNYLETERRRIKLVDLLWEQGFRHGDHVLTYEPAMGSFHEEVVARFAGSIGGESTHLMSPDALLDIENMQGTIIKPEYRTQRKSQPNLSSHETSMLIYWKPRRRFR
jgi:hypothetical protein